MKTCVSVMLADTCSRLSAIWSECSSSQRSSVRVSLCTDFNPVNKQTIKYSGWLICVSRCAWSIHIHYYHGCYLSSRRWNQWLKLTNKTVTSKYRKTPETSALRPGTDSGLCWDKATTHHGALTFQRCLWSFMAVTVRSAQKTLNCVSRSLLYSLQSNAQGRYMPVTDVYFTVVATTADFGLISTGHTLAVMDHVYVCTVWVKQPPTEFFWHFPQTVGNF